MPNLSQTQIFYKAGQTRLTRAKCDPVDSDDPDDLTRLQRCRSHIDINAVLKVSQLYL